MRHLIFGNEDVVRKTSCPLSSSNSTTTVFTDNQNREIINNVATSQCEIVNLANAIQDIVRKREKFFSLELFPSKKCDKEVYQRFFSELNQCSAPLFYALTWHDKSKSDASYLPLEIVRGFPNNTLLHIAVNNLKKCEVANILNEALAQGKTNIFALRGDSCTGTGDFKHAVDLVKFIRTHYDSKFVVCVAGYPEMHPESISKELDISYLKAKIDAGADFIITQIFFESKVFVKFVEDCRKFGITVPIIPGIFPIPSFNSLLRMAKLCSVEIPQTLLKDLQPVKDNDEAVCVYGTALARKLITEILESGAANGFHLFSLNRTSIALDICRNLFK